MNATNRTRKSIVTITALSLILGLLTLAPRNAEAVVGGTAETNNKFTWIVDLYYRLTETYSIDLASDGFGSVNVTIQEMP